MTTGERARYRRLLAAHDPANRFGDDWDGRDKWNTCCDSDVATGPYLASSEAVALGRQLRPLLEKEAKQRQRDHGGTAPGKRKNTSSESDEVLQKRTDDQVASAVGMGRDRYRKGRVRR